MRRDKRSLALTPHEQVLCRHLVNGLANRPLAHAKANCQFRFAWDNIARAPLTRFQAVHDQPADLTIEWTERR